MKIAATIIASALGEDQKISFSIELELTPTPAVQDMHTGLFEDI